MNVAKVNIIDVATQQVVEELTDKMVIDPAKYPAGLNFQVLTTPEKVGSLSFDLDDVVRVEQTAPYAVGGDAGGVFPDMKLPLGKHVLKIKVFSKPAAEGTPDEEKNYSFDMGKIPVTLVGLNFVYSDGKNIKLWKKPMEKATVFFADGSTMEF